MKRKLGWFGLGFAGAELAAAILPPLVCVPAAAFLVCLALLWIKRRRDSAIPVLGALFRENKKTNTRRELLVFLTPRLVDSSSMLQNRF